MKQVTKNRWILIISLVFLITCIELTGTQRVAHYVCLGFVIYFFIVGIVLGLMWHTRKLGKRYQRRKDAEEYARNVKAYMDNIDN